eukprot:CAMPEP_0119016630 /NCGR_PEP_ID=MMETSP1176-20130426/13894_1 /TAXON_ID=265551 /ORGANISM="Synedropsis recta cf, Strain CCMP1620" /LENGTH=101 /DNA_ID=CAMNT_0006970121 /DNA_START=399 /DNA_END=704 /DNA_ORIENTATION=-
MTCAVAQNAGMLGWLPLEQCHQLQDACLCMDPLRQSWPDLVGMEAEQAKLIIELQEPTFTVIVVQASADGDGGVVSADYRDDRVWIWTNEDGTVKRTPMIG